MPAAIAEVSLTAAERGEYQMYFIGWSGRTDPDGNIYSFAKTKQPQNSTGISNPDVDKALDDARLVSDFAARKAIYERMTRQILEDEPIIYLYHRNVLIAHTAKLEGYKQMPDGLVRVIGLKLK